jgi:hypothetical protein
MPFDTRQIAHMQGNSFGLPVVVQFVIFEKPQRIRLNDAP